MKKREGAKKSSLDMAGIEALKLKQFKALNSSSKEEVLSFKASLKLKEPQRAGRADKVRGIACRLASKLDAPQFTGFFLKCGWHLSENQIECILERALAQDGNHRLYYFIGAAKAEMNV